VGSSLACTLCALPNFGMILNAGGRLDGPSPSRPLIIVVTILMITVLDPIARSACVLRSARTLPQLPDSTLRAHRRSLQSSQRRSIGLNESLDLIERHVLEGAHDSTRTDIDQ
jgi:hypothetical protein